jgi:hypothetical protein
MMLKESLIQKLIARQVILGYICDNHYGEIDRIKEKFLYLTTFELIELIDGYEDEMRRLCRIEPVNYFL